MSDELHPLNLETCCKCGFNSFTRRVECEDGHLASRTLMVCNGCGHEHLVSQIKEVQVTPKGLIAATLIRADVLDQTVCLDLAERICDELHVKAQAKTPPGQIPALIWHRNQWTLACVELTKPDES